MEPVGKRLPTNRSEKIIASLGVLLCWSITVLIWIGLRAQQSMWPLPGLYFVEMAALSGLSAVLFIRGEAWGRWLVWGAVGLMSGFSILGALSVGFFYLPIAIVFAGLSVHSDLHYRLPLGWHLGLWLLAGLAQTVLMLAVIH